MEVKKSMIFPIIATWKESVFFFLILNSTSWGQIRLPILQGGDNGAHLFLLTAHFGGGEEWK